MLLPILKYKFWRLSYCELEMLSKPVVLSEVAPVSCWYLLKASVPLSYQRPCKKRVDSGSPVAMRMRVVPVSTIPAVLDRMLVLVLS